MLAQSGTWVPEPHSAPEPHKKPPRTDSRTCTGGPLAPGSGGDLEVTGPCTVGAGTYQYRNVNIYGGGSLIFSDAVIDFWAQSILVENHGSLIAGSGSHPIGAAGGLLTIHLYGNDQGPSGAGIACKTDVRCGVDPSIWTMAPSAKVTLPGGVTDYFYAYAPLDYDNADPNAYFGYKVLAVSYGGTLNLFGSKGAS
ncbi:MAG TPA: G8 domain-containing protein, partial [Terriglobales bacterium]